MLKTRVITAAILLPAVLAILLFGSMPLLRLSLMVCIFFSVKEAAEMLIPAFERRLYPDSGISGGLLKRWVFFCVLVGWTLFFLSSSGDYEAGRGGIAIGFLLLMVVGVFSAYSTIALFKSASLKSGHITGVK